MRDYSQYASRIPTPTKHRKNSNFVSHTKVQNTRNVIDHPLAKDQKESDGNQNVPNKTRDSKQGLDSSSNKDNKNNVGSSPTPVTPPKSMSGSSNSHSKSNSPNAALTPSDALSLKQNGPQATIAKLRTNLELAQAKDLNSKAALAKSDAVILELRTSLSQVKTQLQAMSDKEEQAKQTMESPEAFSRSAHAESPESVKALHERIQDLQRKLDAGTSGNSAVGELQLQLDRAHAQIVTADMVRKELEDTLEAEQYTWELRVQDQEQQLEAMRSECTQLTKDLEEARAQWKDAESDWNKQTQDLQQQLTQARSRLAATQALQQASSSSSAGVAQEGSSSETKILQSQLAVLKKERDELQSCLDETMQELEAADAELQAGERNGQVPADVLEEIQHLLRWIHQAGPKDASSPQRKRDYILSEDPKTLLKEMQSTIEKWMKEASLKNESQSSVLKMQVEQYKQELQSREESTTELRESLKEAVALLKPLQDEVSTAGEEKARLQSQLESLQSNSQQYHQERIQQRSEIEKLKAEILQLEQQVEEQKSIATARGNLLASSNQSPITPRTSRGSLSPQGQYEDETLTKIQRARDELRRKRETEGNLQQLLKDAQTRFRSMHQQNEDVTARNRQLQGQLQQAGTQISNPSGPSPEDQISLLKKDLAERQMQIEQLQQALEENGQGQLHELGEELAVTKRELANKEQSERLLNKSLKDALALLKPLQLHLEEAEREKMGISKELRNLRKRFRQLQMSELGSVGDDHSRSTFGGDVSVELIKIKEELEDTVRQLEVENSQLHDALEDLSADDVMPDTKWRQKMAEINSRYEVTQNKLEDAHVENHALAKALKQKDNDEEKQKAEIERLQNLLNQSQTELGHAKAIAKTALIKVEELTMNNIEEISMSRSRDGTGDKMQFPVSTPADFSSWI